jgi:hypothetical protein
MKWEADEMKSAFSILARFTASFTLGAILVGCASTPPATDNIARARTLVDQAASGGAQRYAAADLDRARDSLRKAVVANEENELELAARLADEAAVDAELALARAQSEEAAQAAAEIQRGVEALRRETQRNSGTPAPAAGG